MALKADYLSADMKILVSAFGENQFPTSQGMDPTATCTDMAYFVMDHHLDGIDIAWHDYHAMAAGTGEDWLI